MSSIIEIEVINFESRFFELEILTIMKMILLFDFQIKEIFDQKALLYSHRREAKIGCVNIQKLSNTYGHHFRLRVTCNAAGLSWMTSAASLRALDAFCSPSAAITLIKTERKGIVTLW